jgi:hypothetical protein
MKQRGSALVYVIIVVFAITSIVIMSARMSSASESEFQNNYLKAKFDTMASGVVAQASSDCYKGTMTLASRTTNYADTTLTTTVTKNASMPRAYDMAITGRVGDRDFRVVKTMGNRVKPNPAFYGIWVAKDYSDSALATNVTGSAYFTGSALLSGVWNVSDDLLVRGSSTLSLGTTVGGSYLTGVRQQTMTVWDSANYTPLGTQFSSNNTAGITFAAPDAAGKYNIQYRTNNFTMNGGTISGKGTLVFDGNLTVNGNYAYADANSRAVILVKGNLVINTLVTHVVGTYLVQGNISLNGVTLTVDRGNLCCINAFNRLLCAVTVNQETAFVNSQDECTNHRLPGYFP